MNWLKIIIDIIGMIIPMVAHKGKKKLEQEFAIAKKTIDILSSDLTPEKKGEVIETAIGNLKSVTNFKKRACKKLDKAKIRIYKKIF